MGDHGNAVGGLGGTAANAATTAGALLAAHDSDDVGGHVAAHALGDGAAGAAAAAAEGLHKLHDAHAHLHRHHMHTLTGGRHSGTGLIWLLVFLHLGFIGYWLYVYWRQQKQRAAAGKKEPEKVNCVYEFALPTLNLAQATKGLGLTGNEKIP